MFRKRKKKWLNTRTSLLGHKNIKNPPIYTQLGTFENDEYICKAASNIKEATELIEAGFEYVCAR